VDNLKWQLLVEVSGRLEAELLQSHLRARGIEVELFQEAIGHHIYPVMVDGLGRVQLFVPKKQFTEAKGVLAEHQASEKEL
jgi:hypothetical protein